MRAALRSVGNLTAIDTVSTHAAWAVGHAIDGPGDPETPFAIRFC